jgi:hypothetical protein
MWGVIDMIYKLLGMLLLTPLLAIILNYWICKHDGKKGKKWTEEDSNKYFVASITFLLMLESFGVGVYLLFK